MTTEELKRALKRWGLPDNLLQENPRLAASIVEICKKSTGELLEIQKTSQKPFIGQPVELSTGEIYTVSKVKWNVIGPLYPIVYVE